MPTIGNLKLGYWSSLPTTHITEKYCWANWGRRIWLGDFNKRVFLQLQFALQFLTTNSNYFRNSRRECSPLDNSGCPLCPLRVWFFRRDLWERAGCTCGPCAWRSRRSRISCQAQARGKTSIWKLAACGERGACDWGVALRWWWEQGATPKAQPTGKPAYPGEPRGKREGRVSGTLGMWCLALFSGVHFDMRLHKHIDNFPFDSILRCRIYQSCFLS